jgi:mono/diheme cytochrome c family protein
MDGAGFDLNVSFVTRFAAAKASTGRRPALVAWLAAATCLLYAAAGVAQDDAKAKAGLETWRSSGCADCHGPFADGNRDDDDFPQGANLRTTRLDGAGLKQTISCGRPGTGMPSFDEGAYTSRACYGRPLGARPDNLQPTPRTLSLDEIDALVAYLRTRIVGHGKVTREECLLYYESKADCDDFK